MRDGHTIIFNGTDLSELIRIRWEVDEQILPGMSDTTVVVGNSAGAKFIHRDIGTRIIEVPYHMIDSSQDKREKLTTVLNVTEPKKLILTDRPDTYYMAIPDGNIGYGKKGTIDESTITFIASDPYRYEIKNKPFAMQTDGTISISNNGNVPTPVSFSVVNNAESGYVGFTNSSGIIQIGDPQEVDGEVVDETFNAINNSWNDSTELAQWTLNKYKPQYPYNNELTGTMSIKYGTNRDKALYANSYSAGSVATMWYGASFYRPFDTDKLGNSTSKNWQLTTLVGSSYNTIKSIGIQEMTIVDDQGKAIAGYRFRKINYSRNMELFFFVGDTIFKKWTGNTDWFLKEFVGNISIEKVDNTFTFRVVNSVTKVGGTYVQVDEVNGARIGAGVNYWVAKNGASSFIKDQLFWVNVRTAVNGFKDITNQFQADDSIQVDVTDTTVKNYLNDLPRYDQKALGSTPILAPVGESTINVSWSSFTTTAPTVIATIRERWI